MISTIIEKRSRKGFWVYILLGLVYIVFALWYAEELRFHGGIPIQNMWPLAIPLLLITFQIVYPTMLAWIVIFLPSALYTSVGIYYFAKNTLGASWEYDQGGYFLGLAVISVMVGLCFGLYKNRPLRMTKTAEPSGAADRR